MTNFTRRGVVTGLTRGLILAPVFAASGVYSRHANKDQIVKDALEEGQTEEQAIDDFREHRRNGAFYGAGLSIVAGVAYETIFGQSEEDNDTPAQEP